MQLSIEETQVYDFTLIYAIFQQMLSTTDVLDLCLMT